MSFQNPEDFGKTFSSEELNQLEDFYDKMLPCVRQNCRSDGSFDGNGFNKCAKIWQKKVQMLLRQHRLSPQVKKLLYRKKKEWDEEYQKCTGRQEENNEENDDENSLYF